MENKRPGAQGPTPQRRPPVPRSNNYPPPQSRQPAQTRTYPPRTTQMRSYPPPHMTQTRQASQPRRMPQTSQVRQTPQASQRRTSPKAQLRRTPQPRTATVQVTQPEPEPRFRDVLWPQNPDTPAHNRIALLCALLYALIHVLCGVLLIYPLNLLTARMPFVLSGLVRAFLPALIAALLCTLTRFPLRLETRVGLSAYRKLLRIVLTLLVGVLLLMWGEWEALKQVARFVLMFVSAPLLTGTGLSVGLLYLEWLYDLEDADE